jgi:hypothetical protein
VAEWDALLSLTVPVIDGQDLVLVLVPAHVLAGQCQVDTDCWTPTAGHGLLDNDCRTLTAGHNYLLAFELIALAVPWCPPDAAQACTGIQSVFLAASYKHMYLSIIATNAPIDCKSIS